MDKIYLTYSNDEFRKAVKVHHPRLAFLESNCWHEATPYMIAQYANKFPQMSIAVFSYERLTPCKAAGFVNLGTSYVDLRLNNEDEIAEAFCRIVQDKYYLPQWVEAVMGGYELASPEYCLLNKCEIPVLRLLAMGNSIEDIALKLAISAGTVRNHISNIHKKFTIHSHVELVGLALRIGIVHPGELITDEINIKVLEREARDVYTNKKR
jgi:DNA-binding NarL/FixJ family response regulator